ncbi:MAG: hypothetical protein HOB29_04725, partial [Planctomycetaceae bacterium]|nr:hypothetical protein [Planctomycetaceae bacterium]MBT5124974.1 hypothetical protein [Planctomycetaceae bacterium]MBT5599648.1 hypothetical protein [Planctomycetaceae bacterium]
MSIIKRILSICHRKIIPIQRTGYFRASIRAEQLEPRLVLSGVVLSGCNNDDEPITLDTIELHDGTGNSNLSIQQLIELKSLQNVNDGTVESIFATFENISDMDDLYDQISHEKGGEFKVDDIAARAIDDLITRPQQIISKVSRRHNNNIMPAASEQAEGEGSPLPGTIYDSPTNDTVHYSFHTSSNSSRGPPAEGESNTTAAGDIFVVGGNSADIDTTPNVNVDTNGDGQADLLNATLKTWAFDAAETLTLQFPTISTTLSLVGEFAIAWITPNGEFDARYTAVKMGDVIVTTASANSADFGMTGDLTFTSLDYSNAATGFDRLGWNTAFDFNEDGIADPLDPGTDLASTPNLAIDYTSDFIHRVTGSISGTGGTGTQLFQAGPVALSGATNFASTRYITNEIDLLTDATLD